MNREDTFKRAQEIDEKGIDKSGPVVPFINEINEEYKEAKNMIKPMFPDEVNSTFSSDLNIFNEACTKFINYIKQCTENTNELYVLYILRNGNLIDYGRCEQGIRTTIDTIKMASNEDLKKIYRLLQEEFSSSFNNGYRHTFGEGWSLVPTIGENVMININSNNQYDLDWFYEEVHKKQEKDSLKK